MSITQSFLYLTLLFSVILIVFLYALQKIKRLQVFIAPDESIKSKVAKSISKQQRLTFVLGLVILTLLFSRTGYIEFDNLFKTEEDIFQEQVKAVNVSVLFKQECSTCHSVNASGGIGPNLTDNYWIHDANKKENLVNYISHGFLDKGMPPFDSHLSKIEIAALANFVYGLKGTEVKGKDPQGYLYEADKDSYNKIGTTMIMADIEVPESIPVIPEGGNIENGKELFNVKLGCAHCHGTNAYGHIDNRNIKESNKRYGKNWKRVVDQVLHEGRKGTAMPEWSYLSMQELKDVKAFVISIQK